MSLEAHLERNNQLLAEHNALLAELLAKMNSEPPAPISPIAEPEQPEAQKADEQSEEPAAVAPTPEPAAAQPAPAPVDNPRYFIRTPYTGVLASQTRHDYCPQSSMIQGVMSPGLVGRW